MVLFCWMAAAIAAHAQTFMTLASFNGTSGFGPNGLMQGTDGNFYGTTVLGGTSTNCTDGCGAVFKMTPSGTLTALHSFSGTDGSRPYSELIQGTDGNFYGTTANGGASSNCIDGCGTVFKITALGVLTTLHSFDSTDGSYPDNALIQGTDGNFYGSTTGGGRGNCTSGCGTIFKITPTGILTTLHRFDDTDGSDPGALIQGTDGNFYGNTNMGGTNRSGTIFKMTIDGTLVTLHNFDGTDGYPTSGPLVQGTDGNFYGTTEGGGDYTDGTIFKITPAGVLTNLHNFGDNYDDGSHPVGMVLGTDGNLYGATQLGGSGSGGLGTVFRITPEHVLTILHSFDGNDGAVPPFTPVQATSGAFYGTTYEEGGDGGGTVYSLSIGLGPFVETNPTSGTFGKKVTIFGNDLAETTNVTFNGTQATFKASSTHISTTVPTGATTGPVEVVTPKQTLKSNQPFRVP